MPMARSSSDAFSTDVELLNETLMDLTMLVHNLHEEIYRPGDPVPTNAYDFYEFHNAQPFSPDQAIAASAMGYCFGVFRGTKAFSARDRSQNLRAFPKQQVCPANSVSEDDCCVAHKGFLNIYNSRYVQDFENDLLHCMENFCTDPTGDCLVLGGMSQGAGIATIASVIFADYNPIVIGFGQPGSVASDCEAIESDRHYRFIGALPAVPEYDPVALIGPQVGLYWYGHTFLASDQDVTGMAYLGLDNQGIDLPSGSAEAHGASLRNVAAVKEYNDSEGTYPVRVSGYVTGSACTTDEECDSQFCDGNVCV